MKELVKEGSRVKVLNFGSLNIDYTYQVDHFVRAGETMSSESLQVFSGGKGLNQSIALSKVIFAPELVVRESTARIQPSQ